ncbi:MAG: class I SAM-dependent methyltransferase, partial [Planctomycetota bacterium]
MTTAKEAASAYGEAYQRGQAEKYRNRRNNHWRFRIELAHRLFERYAAPRFRGRPREDIVVVDAGCSIGTFAIEFARMGYRSFGVDFDPSALKVARELAGEEKVSPEFVCGDVAEWDDSLPPIDILVCFDLFEHLPDGELGVFLSAVKKRLSARGCILFHTFPTQYDYLLYAKGFLR